MEASPNRGKLAKTVDVVSSPLFARNTALDQTVLANLLVEDEGAKLDKILLDLKAEKATTVGGLVAFLGRSPTPENLRVLGITSDQWMTLREDVSAKVGKTRRYNIIVCANVIIPK